MREILLKDNFRNENFFYTISIIIYFFLYLCLFLSFFIKIKKETYLAFFISYNIICFILFLFLNFNFFKKNLYFIIFLFGTIFIDYLGISFIHFVNFYTFTPIETFKQITTIVFFLLLSFIVFGGLYGLKILLINFLFKKKFLEDILSFFKGCLIGVCDLVPGLSGGAIALFLGIYDRYIYAFNQLGSKKFLIFTKLSFSFKVEESKKF